MRILLTEYGSIFWIKVVYVQHKQIYVYKIYIAFQSEHHVPENRCECCYTSQCYEVLFEKQSLRQSNGVDGFLCNLYQHNHISSIWKWFLKRKMRFFLRIWWAAETDRIQNEIHLKRERDKNELECACE